MAEPHVIDRILAAAQQELRGLGVKGFRSRRVAELAKISLGTLTHYFPTKEQLLDTAIHEFVRMSSENWRREFDNVSDAGLDPVVEGFYKVCRQCRPLVRALVYMTARDGKVWGIAPQVVVPVLEEAGATLGESKRLLAHSVIALSMVYSVLSDDDLCAIVGADDPESAHAAVLDHLKSLAAHDDPG